MGDPSVTGGPPVGKWQRLACCGSRNVARALPAADTELTPRNSPPGLTCTGSSCPERVPTCSHPVTQQGFGGPERWQGGQGCCGVERGRRQAGTCPLPPGPVPGCVSYKHHKQQGQHPAASRPATPCPLVGTPPGVRRVCPPWEARPWLGSRVDLWLSQASQSSQLSPDNLHWPDLAPGSHPGVGWSQGPSERPARTVSGHGVAAALASSQHPQHTVASAPPAASSGLGYR